MAPHDFPTPAERRRGARRRLRLHAARIVDPEGRFLGEGAVSDASTGGARLRLRDDASLPERFLVFDAAGARVAEARLIWSKPREAGLTLGDWRPLAEAPAALRRRLAGDYYAAD